MALGTRSRESSERFPRAAPRTRQVVRRACLTITAVILCVAAVGVANATEDQTPTATSFAQDIESLLSFVGGEPLTSAERDRVTAQTRDGFRRDPAAIGRADATIKQLLVKLPEFDQPTKETVREELRVRLALLPDAVTERQILDHHDPPIAIDRENEAVVTARTILTIREASRWMAKHVGIAGPGDDYVSSETKYLRENFSSFSADQQAACTHIARNMAASLAVFDGLTADERKTRLTRVRSAINASTPLDVITVLGMASSYVDTQSFERKLLSTWADMLRLQNLDNVTTALGGHI